MKIIYGILIIILAQSVAAGNLCNNSIEIFTKKQFYENESIDFQFGLSTKPPEYVIEYWVEDIYDNIVKKKRNTTNLNKKSYSPHISGVQAFVIMARFPEIDCLSNVMFEKTVLYKGEIQSENQCCACIVKKGLEFIIEKPEVVYNNNDFNIIVGIQNYDNQPHIIKLWSYVYRGSKVYSGTREGNLIVITITPNSSEEIKLENTVDADHGTYKLKIKINKDGQKTSKEFTYNISVMNNPQIFSNAPSIQLSKLHFTNNPTKIHATINNTHNIDLNFEVELNSIYSFQKKKAYVESESIVVIDFEVDFDDATNPFFVKLYLNDSLIDVQEMVIDNGNPNPNNLPFRLVSGDLLFNTTNSIYESSSMKSIQIAIYLFLTLSVVLNCGLLISKHVEPNMLIKKIFKRFL